MMQIHIGSKYVVNFYVYTF